MKPHLNKVPEPWLGSKRNSLKVNDMTAHKLHRWNAVFLCIFIALHFVTHLSGVFGVEAYNSVQKTMRYVYRNPVIEPFVLLSAVLQIGWGALLLGRKIREKWAHIQVISGAIFLFFITEHLIALVLARWVDGYDTNFYWPASVMNGAPFTWYFFPYYFLGVSSLFVHLGCACRLMLLRSTYRQYADTGFWAPSVAGIAMALVINFTLLGGFFEIQLPDEWVTYLRRFIAYYSQ